MLRPSKACVLLRVVHEGRIRNLEMNAVNGMQIGALKRPIALHILVVDDDKNTRDILLEALSLFGAQVRSAQSAAQAREVLQEWHADLMISDLGMPDEDGCDLIRDVRTRPIKDEARIPAIALTGYTREEDRQRALAAGFNEVLTKPAELEALVETIRRLAFADPGRRR